MPRLPAHVRSLAAIGRLDSCSRRQRRELASLGTVVDVAAGRVLWCTGAAWSQAVIVLDGTLVASAAGGSTRVLTAGDGCGWDGGGVGASTTEHVEARTATTIAVFTPLEVAAVRRAAPLLSTVPAAPVRSTTI